MVSRSILRSNRYNQFAGPERHKILACEHTAHQCTMEVLAGCREHLPEDRAVSAAIVGIFSALGRIVAQSVSPDTMSIALAAMLKREIAAWPSSKELAHDQS